MSIREEQLEFTSDMADRYREFVVKHSIVKAQMTRDGYVPTRNEVNMECRRRKNAGITPFGERPVEESSISTPVVESTTHHLSDKFAPKGCHGMLLQSNPHAFFCCAAHQLKFSRCTTIF